MEGFFSLQTPYDLLKKLEYDFARLQSNPSNAYIAFDFFVTAEHLLDWQFAGNRKECIAERKTNELLQVCSHLASGAKHFKLDDKRHDSVKSTNHTKGVFNSAIFNKEIFNTGGLLVELSDDTFESANSLAEKVLRLWKERLGSKTQF